MSQFSDEFNHMLSHGQVLESQRDDINSLWLTAYELGSEAGYDDGVCDGYSQAKDEEDA